MFSAKKQNALFFLIVLMLFGAILVFLVFFTPGLSVSIAGSGTEQSVVVKNTSSHAIRNISVSASDGNLMDKIAELLPKQERSVPLGNLAGTVTIIVRAPFHASVSKDVFSDRPAVNISYNVQQQSVFFVGSEAKILLEICRQGSLPTHVTVSESFDETAFDAPEKSVSADFNSENCVSTDFAFVPKKAGDFEILFNIKAENVSESFKRTVSVTE